MSHYTQAKYRKSIRGKLYSFPYYAGSKLDGNSDCYLYKYLSDKKLTQLFKPLVYLGVKPDNEGGRYEITLSDLLKVAIIIIKAEPAMKVEPYQTSLDYVYDIMDIWAVWDKYFKTLTTQHPATPLFESLILGDSISAKTIVFTEV